MKDVSKMIETIMNSNIKEFVCKKQVYHNKSYQQKDHYNIIALDGKISIIGESFEDAVQKVFEVVTRLRKTNK